jgi:hypothetical protein
MVCCKIATSLDNLPATTGQALQATLGFTYHATQFGAFDASFHGSRAPTLGLVKGKIE